MAARTSHDYRLLGFDPLEWLIGRPPALMLRTKLLLALLVKGTLRALDLSTLRITNAHRTSFKLALFCFVSFVPFCGKNFFCFLWRKD